MTVRKNRNYGIIFIITGIILFIDALYIRQIMLMASSILIIICGLPYLFGDYFTLDRQNKKLVLFALFGPKKWEFPFDKISAEDKKIYAELKGVKRRLPVYKMVAQADDWKKLINELK
jgi:hypothetical protein